MSIGSAREDIRVNRIRTWGQQCHIAIAPEEVPSLTEDLCVLSFQVLSRPRLPHTIAEAVVSFPEVRQAIIFGMRAG